MRYLAIALLSLVLAILAACGGATEQPAVDQPAESVTLPNEAPLGDMANTEPITFSGTGTTSTDPVTINWDNARVVMSHDGSRNFTVTAYQAGVESLLANVIGDYEGARPLFGNGEVYFGIDADGDWTVIVEPLGQAEGAAFAGSGPGVSGAFDPPPAGPVEYSHDGSRNFVVRLHCASGSELVENEIGGVSGSAAVTFGTGPCFWEVEGDGSWSVTPK